MLIQSAGNYSCSFKVPVTIQQSTRRHIPEKLESSSSPLCEDFKSRMVQNALKICLAVSIGYISMDPLLPYVTAVEGQ
jgi:hypothetical protein